jgi:hypothetical protein
MAVIPFFCHSDSNSGFSKSIYRQKQHKNEKSLPVMAGVYFSGSVM